MPANIAEGFGQQSDRQFARYLFIARGSAQEVRSHLTVARGRDYLSETETMELCNKYEEIARMLSGLIKYLLASDRKVRGQRPASDSGLPTDCRLLTETDY